MGNENSGLESTLPDTERQDTEKKKAGKQWANMQREVVRKRIDLPA